MADRGDGGHAIDEREDVPAEHVAHDVRMMRHHQLGEHRF